MIWFVVGCIVGWAIIDPLIDAAIAWRLRREEKRP